MINSEEQVITRGIGLLFGTMSVSAGTRTLDPVKVDGTISISGTDGQKEYKSITMVRRRAIE